MSKFNADEHTESALNHYLRSIDLEEQRIEDFCELVMEHEDEALDRIYEYFRDELNISRKEIDEQFIIQLRRK